MKANARRCIRLLRPTSGCWVFESLRACRLALDCAVQQVQVQQMTQEKVSVSNDMSSFVIRGSEWIANSHTAEIER